MAPVTATSINEELHWLLDNPEFEERPATLREFVGPDYLNIADMVRPRIMLELENILGDKVTNERITKYPYAMITGGIGIGKTTVASIVLPYLAHYCLCLRDPQKFFGLLPGSRIAFMQMSTSGKQAKEVVFGDLKARVEHSPWFKKKYMFDGKFKNQLRFPKDIWILPGDSAETTFEGYNILGGILDEADSHKVTDTKDYAEQGFSTINSRIESRFGTRGFLLVIGQMKRGNGFAARKFEEFGKNPNAYRVRMSIWESFGWEKFLRPDGTRDSFWYNVKRHEIVPAGVAGALNSDDIIEIPTTYRTSFDINPEKALRDLAGIPPLTGAPFISLSYKVEECRDRWIQRFNIEGLEGECRAPLDPRNQFADWFRCYDPIKRVGHIDMAYSANGDALGLAIGHVPEMVEVGDELKPFICYDLLMRIHAPAGREIFLGDVRQIIYTLRDEFKFKIRFVSVDGFQSTDTRQQLERRRIGTETISVDKNMGPYEDLREAIYENRVAFPEYLVKIRQDDTTLTEIAVKELMELVDTGKKVDHPENGSKDVADAMAGVAYTLMGDRTYHRKKQQFGHLTEPEGRNVDGIIDRRFGGFGVDGPSAPIPPSSTSLGPLWSPKGRT